MKGSHYQLQLLASEKMMAERLGQELCNWVDLIQPFCTLRTLASQNVRVGTHYDAS